MDNDENHRLISTRVPAAVGEQFRAVATRHDRSVSAELRRAISEHLERTTNPETKES